LKIKLAAYIHDLAGQEMKQDVHVKLNAELPGQRNVQIEETSVRQQIRLQMKEKLVKFYIWSVL